MTALGSDKVKLLTAAFLVFLLAAWVAIMFPALRRARRETPITSTQLFQKALDAISPSSNTFDFLGSGAAAPLRLRPLRCATLGALVLTVATTAVAALAYSPTLWELHLAAVAALAFYLSWLLLQGQPRRVQRTRNVRSLDAYRESRSPAPVAEPHVRVVGGG